MVQKVDAAAQEDSFLAKAVGLGLIVLGILFVLFALMVIVISKRAPVVDSNIKSPILSQNVSTTVNADKLKISGVAKENSDVIVYVDGVEVADYVHTDGNGYFEVEVALPGEGKHTVEVAQVEGFPKRRRSAKSQSLAIVVDKEAPQDVAELTFDPVSKDGKFAMSGVAEPNMVVVLRGENGERVAQTRSDENGNFSFEDVQLNAKETDLQLVIVDEAGNEKVSTREIIVSYPDFVAVVAENPEVDESVDDAASEQAEAENTDTQVADEQAADENESAKSASTTTLAVSDTDTTTELPESAGELDAAMEIMRSNSAIMMIALLGMGVFAINMGVVTAKLRR